jgi:hypoxanthine phosphoribosyltransferase
METSRHDSFESLIEHSIKEILVTEREIQERVRELAEEITRDYRGADLVLVSVLRGAAFFLADLARQIRLPLAIDFMAISSYGADYEHTGVVRLIKDLEEPIQGKHVLIVEDIIDTGLTLQYLLRLLKARGPASIEICTLLDKSARRLVQLPIRYRGFEIPDRFVVGYGLDFEQRFRNLPFIGVIEVEELTR